MGSVIELEHEARQLLVAYSLTSTKRAGAAAIDGSSRSRPGSSAPNGEREHPAEAWAVELERLEVVPGTTSGELERFVRDLRAELEQVRRRPLAQVVDGDTLEDLEAAVVDRGEGWDARSVAVALRTSERLVARIRIANGLDERGRPKRINGTADGLELLHAGLSLRAASLISGVPRSTLHEQARRRG